MLNAIELLTYERLFIIGDIHGSIELLSPLIEHLLTVEGLTDNDQVVFLGDYIDRGTDSMHTVSLLIRLKSFFPRTIFLRGNHEDMLLSFLGLNGSYGDSYLHNGGKKMLQDYGITYEDIGYWHSQKERQELANLFPLEHMKFYTSLSHIVLSKKLLMVHAGLNLKSKLEDQNITPSNPMRGSEDSIFWIRDSFYSQCKSIKEPYMGRTIIHGHTIVPDISFHLPMRIMLDTGSYQPRGKITCFEANENDLKKSKIIQSTRNKGIIIK